MKTSQKGIDLIKKFEGCRLKAYKCPANVWTIGYGHTGNVKPNDVITQEQAEELLKRDLISFENSVSKLIKIAVTQNEFDALVSFAFNVGVGALANSTLLKLLNAGNKKGAAEQFSRWVYAGNKVLEGLIKRRNAEKDLFMS